MFRMGTWILGQLRLVHCLATETFQEVGIDLVGDSRFRIPGPDAGLDRTGWDGGVGRGAAHRAVRRADHLLSSYLRNF